MLARFDILLERSSELNEIESFTLKAGDEVALKQEDGGPLEASTSTGLVLGTVPAAEAEKIQVGGYKGYIRTLQKNPGTSLIRDITVRFRADEKSMVEPVGKYFIVVLLVKSVVRPIKERMGNTLGLAVSYPS
jgi:hypothetical protein